jgi:hypothetical protein
LVAGVNSLLEHWDFGFVHQVLTFSRANNESISSAVNPFRPYALIPYVIARRYGSCLPGG